jgi:hypothetical protein|tara:strand:+ start:3069 stop:3467 length:399 start_codon:yes stop_codon:yes gene_type:complete
MNTRQQEVTGTCFVEASPEQIAIRSEQDAVDLIAMCGGQHRQKLLLCAGNLTRDFFDLKTGLAGQVLQKLATYNIQTAAVLPRVLWQRGRFRELADESNRGRHFRIFQSRGEAVSWLTGDSRPPNKTLVKRS